MNYREAVAQAGRMAEWAKNLGNAQAQAGLSAGSVLGQRTSAIENLTSDAKLILERLRFVAMRIEVAGEQIAGPAVTGEAPEPTSSADSLTDTLHSISCQLDRCESALDRIV